MKRILAFILAFALIFPTTAVIACATTGEVVAVVNSDLEQVSEEVSDENVSNEDVSNEDVSNEDVSDEDVSNEDNSGGSIFENVFNMDTITDLIETIMAALGNIDFSAILDALSGVVDMILNLLGLGDNGGDTPPAEEPTEPDTEPAPEVTDPAPEVTDPVPEQTPSVDNSDNNSSNNNSGNTSNNNINNNVQQSGGTPIEMPLVPSGVWTIVVVVLMVVIGILIIVL